MEQPIRFYDCKDFSDPNKRISIDANTLEDFSKTFDLLIVLGKGRSGIVCGTTEEHMALKIMCYQSIDDDGNPFSDSEENEMSILCLLNELVDTAYIFPRVYGWMIMSTIPKRWIIRLYNVVNDNMKMSYVEKMPFLCIAMEKFDYDIKDKRTLLNDNDIRCILFMLLYGIACARKHLGHFRHRDIHEGNIMLSSVSTESEFQFEYTPYTMTNIRFVPKLIDYGLSRKSPEPMKWHDEADENEDKPFLDFYKTKYPPRNDLIRLRGLILSLYEERNLNADEAHVFLTDTKYNDILLLARNEYETIFDILSDSFFKIENITSRKRSKFEATQPTEKCITCYSSSPGLLYDTNATFQFCNEQCASKFETFRRFAPIRFKK